MTGAGKRGFASVPSGAVIRIGRKSPEFVGTGSWVAVSSRMESDRQQYGDVDRALERHVDREIDLRRGPGQIDVEVRSLDRDRNSDHEILVGRVRVVEEAVEPPFRGIGAVGEPLDLAAEHPLRVVHEIVARRAHRLDPEPLDELEEAIGADPARGNLRLHVADDELGSTDVVPQQAPDPLVTPALLLDLDRVELQAFGVRVGRVDDAAGAGRERAEIEVVRGRGRERHQLAAVEDGYDERHVGPVRRAVVRMVVDDHVAGAPLLAELGEAAVDAPYVARYRARLERRRLARLAELARLVIHDRAAEVLRLADDGRVGHASQLVAHLDGDRVERTAYDCRGDCVDAGSRRAHRAWDRTSTPASPVVPAQAGGTSTVVSR